MARSILLANMMLGLRENRLMKYVRRAVLIYTVFWAECPRFGIPCDKQSVDLWDMVLIQFSGGIKLTFHNFSTICYLRGLKYFLKNLSIIWGKGMYSCNHKKGCGSHRRGSPCPLLASPRLLECLYSLTVFVLFCFSMSQNLSIGYSERPIDILIL